MLIFKHKIELMFLFHFATDLRLLIRSEFYQKTI